MKKVKNKKKTKEDHTIDRDARVYVTGVQLLTSSELMGSSAFDSVSTAVSSAV